MRDKPSTPVLVTKYVLFIAVVVPCFSSLKLEHGLKKYV